MAKCHRFCLCNHHIMVLLIQFLGDILNAGRVKGTDDRACESQHILFVDGQPELCTVAEVLKHHLCKVDKSVDGIPVAPAALCLDSGGQVKMIHRDQRLDVVFEAFVNQVVVVFNAFGVDCAGPFGNQAGPGDRKAVGLEAHFRHQFDVLFVVMVLVGSDLKIRGSFGNDLDVLYRRAFAVFEAGALNLVGRGGSTPEKVCRKIAMFFCHVDSSFPC